MNTEFLNEVVQGQAAHGKTRRPNYNNPITQQRKRMQAMIDGRARELGKDPADVALEIVDQNAGTLQRYVTMNGEQPLQNPVELATQAFILRNKDIEQVQRIIGCNREDAEAYLDESEAIEMQQNSSDADNFLGAIATALGSVANKGINKIVAKKEAKGKKAGFWKTLADITAPTQQSVLSPAENSGGGLDGLQVFAKDVLDNIKAAEKKKEINRMLPFIIIGVIVLILVVVLITKNASKN